jgi:aminoglycoside phosphotransferase family enzyme
MDIQNDAVMEFAKFSKLQIDDHAAQLVEKYKKNTASTKTFTRLREFNEQLQSLKAVLRHKIDHLAKGHSADADLKTELEKRYNEYINEFLKGDFDRKHTE